MRDSEPTNETGGLIQYTASPYLPVPITLGSPTVTVVQGTNVVTGSGFLASWVGERILIGTFKDTYEITAVNVGLTELTLSATVPQSSESYASVIRPAGMERFRLEDRLETAWAGDVVVKYQKLHPSLIQTTDRLKIPCPQTVALEALQNALMTDKYTVDAERLELALTKAESSEVGTSPFSKKKTVYRDRMFSVRSNGRGRGFGRSRF
jgi:hypothetical protein